MHLNNNRGVKSKQAKQHARMVTGPPDSSRVTEQERQDLDEALIALEASVDELRRARASLPEGSTSNSESSSMKSAMDAVYAVRESMRCGVHSPTGVHAVEELRHEVTTDILMTLRWGGEDVHDARTALRAAQDLTVERCAARREPRKQHAALEAQHSASSGGTDTHEVPKPFAHQVPLWSWDPQALADAMQKHAGLAPLKRGEQYEDQHSGAPPTGQFDMF